MRKLKIRSHLNMNQRFAIRSAGFKLKAVTPSGKPLYGTSGTNALFKEKEVIKARKRSLMIGGPAMKGRKYSSIAGMYRGKTKFSF